MVKETRKSKKKVTQPSKLDSVLIIKKPRTYLHPDIITPKFENEHLSSIVQNRINKFLKTGDPEDIRSMFSIIAIYKEVAFWKQIQLWNVLSFQGDKHAPKLLKMVVNGAALAIDRFNIPKRRGRPSKPIPKGIFSEYKRIKRKLPQSGITNLHKKEIDELQGRGRKKISAQIDPVARKRINYLLTFRKAILTEYLDNIHTRFTSSEIEKLIKKSNSEIAIQILAKSKKIGIRKIKEQIAFEDVRISDAIVTQISNGKEIVIGRYKYEAQRLNVLETFEQNNVSFKNDEFCKIMSKKLRVPREAIKNIISGSYSLNLVKDRTPH